LLVEIRFFLKSTGFTSSTFPTQLDFSQNQLAAITLNTGSPWTLEEVYFHDLRLNVAWGLAILSWVIFLWVS
jgi:hypothetical protein